MNKPIVYLLHGALGSSAELARLKEALLLKYEVKTFDFEGHGTLAASSQITFSIPIFANQLREQLVKETNPVGIFGFSMGGYVAAYLAAKEPQLIKWLYTLGTKFIWTKEASEREAQLLNKTNIETKVPKYASYLAQIHGENWPNVLASTAQMMLDLGDTPAIRLQELSNILIPVAVGLGDRDKMIPLQDALTIYQTLPLGELEIWPKTVHPINQVAIAELAARIHLFDQRCKNQ